MGGTLSLFSSAEEPKKNDYVFSTSVSTSSISQKPYVAEYNDADDSQDEYERYMESRQFDYYD